jgi:hypothetical protein
MSKRKLVLAMEELDLDGRVPEDEENEERAEEIRESESNIEELSEDIDSVESDTETLTKLKDTMEETLDSGKGLSPEAVEIATVVTESIYSKLGLSHKNTIPAVEAFQNRNSKLVATKFAVESISDNLAAINKWTTEKKALLITMKANHAQLVAR